jgi:hypothetical protein
MITVTMTRAQKYTIARCVLIIDEGEEEEKEEGR